MKQQVLKRFPGVSCAWMSAAGEVTTECHGYADRESRAPVDEDTIFPACSISKFITAMCVMKLRERKRIDIDAPVNRYLRRWKLLTAQGSESDAPVRSLLSHTAGTVDAEAGFHGLRRGDPEVRLTDILDGKTAYNDRPARAETPAGTAFEYSDAGYCVLQLMLEEVARRPFEDSAREFVFDPLNLKGTFFASPANLSRFEGRMATGYADQGSPLPGKFPYVPDLAASGLWSTPRELLVIAKAFLAALHGRGALLEKESAAEMAAPLDRFPWTGLGLFMDGQDTLVTRGWGENGQCVMKMNRRTEEASAVMGNRDPGVDQAGSGLEWLADRPFEPA